MPKKKPFSPPPDKIGNYEIVTNGFGKDIYIRKDRNKNVIRLRKGETIEAYIKRMKT